MIRWEQLPDSMKNKTLRPYYDKLKKKKISLCMKRIMDLLFALVLTVVLAPVMAVLAVVSWFLVFVVGLSSGILCIPAAILGFFGLFILFVDSVSYGVGLLVIAFLISPYGLPMLAGWLVAKLHVLRYMLRDWIYG